MRIPWPHILLVLLIVLLLFGASRLPDIARNIGKSMRVMKDEIKDLRDDGTSAAPTQYQAPTGQVPTGYEQTSTPQAPPPQTPPEQGPEPGRRSDT